MAVDQEFKVDCQVWQTFLDNPLAVARPWVDLNTKLITRNLGFHTDASLNKNFGIGCIYANKFWTYAKWEPGFVEEKKPSIEYAELLALCVGVLTWQHELQNVRIILFTDNKSTQDMVNQFSSSCKNCMRLLRILALNNLKFNRRTFARFIRRKDNFLSDALSRQRIGWFKDKAPYMNDLPSPLPNEIWPPSKIWID